MHRALTALDQMEDSDIQINFRTVAAEVRVSTAWLYNQQELRTRIVRLRNRTTQAVPISSSYRERELLSRQSVVATLRHRIKTLEAENRGLLQQLEIAYGKLATLSQG
jgi:hypothetical protein